MSNRLHYVAPSAAIPLGGALTVSAFPPIGFGTIPQTWITLDGVIPEFDLDMYSSGDASITDVKLYGAITSALTFAAIETTAEADDDLFTKVNHGLYTGDGPFTIVNTGGALPGGIVDGANYYAIRVDADTFSVAFTRELAGIGTPVNLTTDGSGTQDITANDDTTKLLWRLVGVLELNMTLASSREGFTTRVQHTPRTLHYGVTWTGTAANAVLALISPLEGR